MMKTKIIAVINPLPIALKLYLESRFHQTDCNFKILPDMLEVVASLPLDPPYVLEVGGYRHHHYNHYYHHHYHQRSHLM